MNYLQMNSSAILARTEENTRASYFYRKTAGQEEFWDNKKPACPVSSPIIKWRRIWERRSPNKQAVPSTAQKSTGRQKLNSDVTYCDNDTKLAMRVLYEHLNTWSFTFKIYN